jgi:hypothetical protein
MPVKHKRNMGRRNKYALTVATPSTTTATPPITNLEDFLAQPLVIALRESLAAWDVVRATASTQMRTALRTIDQMRTETVGAWDAN